MTSYKIATVALIAASFAISDPAFAASKQGGTGSTGNKSNDPQAIQGGTTMQMMDKMKGHKKMAWCSATRTHNCRHHKTM